jgi:recombinational DNA repair protein RecT
MNQFVKSLIFSIAILSVSCAKSVKEQDETTEMPDTTTTNEDFISTETEETSESPESTTDQTIPETTTEENGSESSNVSSLFYITLLVANILFINSII